MNKEKILTTFEDILESKGFLATDIDDFFQAASEILEFMADEVEKNEPYATHSIATYRDAGRDMYDPDEAAECVCTDD